jgi:uncharacterized membrane protein YkoI
MKMTKLRSIIGLLIMALTLGLIVLGGTQTLNAQDTKGKDTVRTEKDDDKDDNDDDERLSPAELAKVKITMEQARATALAKVSGEVIDQELEKEHGRLQYAIDIRTSEGKVFDVEIDAISGEVLQAVEDDDDDDDDDKASAKKPKVVVKPTTAIKKPK